MTKKCNYKHVHTVYMMIVGSWFDKIKWFQFRWLEAETSILVQIYDTVNVYCAKILRDPSSMAR